MDVAVSEAAAEGGAEAAARRFMRARRPPSRSNAPCRHRTISRWMSESVTFKRATFLRTAPRETPTTEQRTYVQHISNCRTQYRRYLKPWVSQSSAFFICTCPYWPTEIVFGSDRMHDVVHVPQTSSSDDVAVYDIRGN